MFLRFAALSLFVCVGCAREPEQPWRKALDQGRVIRLGGDVGTLSPQTTTSAPAPTTPPVIVQTDPRPGTPPVAQQKKIADSLPIPAPPQAVQKKSTEAKPPVDDDPVLLPPK